MKGILTLSVILLVAINANAQVLISLLLGDKLNSGKVEFGLDGGFNLSNIQGLDNASSASRFNIGFYFDVKLKNPSWMIHTGVIVKSNVGANDLPVYSLDNPELDGALAGGSVDRKLGYFYVPLMMKYVLKNNLFLEAGPMFGLMSKSNDIFTKDVQDKDDLTYKIKIKDNYHPLDAGLMAGIGYRLMGGNGMNLAIRYYVGVVDITVDDSGANQYNRSLYFAVGIPIGKGKMQSTEQ